MGNKQSAPSRRRSCPGRPQAMDSTKITMYSPRRTTITHGPVSAGVPILPADANAATSSSMNPTPIWDLLGFTVPPVQGSSALSQSHPQSGPSLSADSDDEQEAGTESSLTSDELDQLALDRQFAILLQIQADIAKAQREKREEKEEQLLKSAMDLSLTEENQAGPSHSEDNAPETEGAGNTEEGAAKTEGAEADDRGELTTTQAKYSVSEPKDLMDIEEDEEKVCSICLEDLAPSITPVTALLCYHVYHVTCINSWRAKGSLECPMCGADTL